MSEDLPGFDRALALVMADLKRTWDHGQVPDLELLRFERTSSDVDIQVAVVGWGWQGNGVPARSFPDVGPDGDPVAAVADAAQGSVMEWQFHVWPVCATHSMGLHASRAEGFGDEEEDLLPGPAGWWCAAEGGHCLAEIGRLGLSTP